MRILIVALTVLAWALPAQAQQFPGYPPSGYLQIGQGSGVPAAWVPNPGLLISNNLSDLANASSGRANLGLGSIATQNANAVAITGGTITGLPTPTVSGDVATKLYVDSVAAGVVVHAAVRLATVAALGSYSYNNGAAGVGATLTASANGALSVDATTAALNDRILVKNEASAANNGLYTVTQTGSVGAPWVLTRSTDANSAGGGSPTKIGQGSYVLVTAGATLINTGWLVNSVVNSIGTDAINWAQFTGNTTGVSSLNGQTGVVTLAPAGGINISAASGTVTVTGAYAPPQGRLTLQTHTPVMTTNQTAKAVIFYDCYRGGSVPVFNGTIDVLLSIPSCEVSTTLQSSGSGVVNNAGVFDVWAIAVGGVLHLCVATNGSGGGWASDTGGSNTARGSGYSAIDNATRPFYTNAAALANCYEGSTNRGTIAVNQASYLGTFWTSAAGQTGYTMGVSAAAPTPACFCIWNAYSRVPAGTTLVDTSATWVTAGDGIVREAGGSGGVLQHLVRSVTGLPDDWQTASYAAMGQASGAYVGQYGQIGIGFNTNAAYSGNIGIAPGSANGLNSGIGSFGTHASGVNYFAAVESAIAGAVTFFGASYSALNYNGQF